MSGQILDVSRALAHARTQHGFSLAEMSRGTPLLIAFLSHFDSPSCRETMADLAQIRSQVEAEGARIALVHGAIDADAEGFLRTCGMEKLPRVSDPHQWLHRSFCLRRGGPLEWFAAVGWKQGLETLRAGPESESRVGDPPQMPGIFLVFDEQVVEEYRHKATGDRPESLWLAAHPVGSLS